MMMTSRVQGFGLSRNSSPGDDAVWWPGLIEVQPTSQRAPEEGHELRVEGVKLK